MEGSIYNKEDEVLVNGLGDPPPYPSTREGSIYNKGDWGLVSRWGTLPLAPPQGRGVYTIRRMGSWLMDWG